MTVDDLTIEELTQIIRGLQMLVDSRYYTVDEIIAQQQLAKLEAELVHAAEVVRDAFNPVELEIPSTKENTTCQQLLLGF